MKSRMFLAGLLLSPSVAAAGGGPWVLARGDQSLYTGIEAQRITELSTSAGSFEGDLIAVDDGITTFGAKLIGSYGLTNRVEAEVRLPWYYVFSNRPGDVCGLLTTEDIDACADNQGIGIIEARTKFLLVDELEGAPLSFSLSADSRLGMFTESERAQLTNIGEGTLDLGASLMAGRTGGLGNGYYTMFLETGWRYRLPMTESYASPDGRTLVAPGWEIHGLADVLVSPGWGVQFGVEVGWLWRPNGNDVEDLIADASDIDRLAALRIFGLSAGGKVIIAAGEKVNLSASVLQSVYTENNPLVTSFSAGLTIRQIFKRRAPDA